MVHGNRHLGYSQTVRISEAGANIVKFGHRLSYGCRVVSIGSFSALDIVGLQVPPPGLTLLVLIEYAISMLFSSSSCGLRYFVGQDRFKGSDDPIVSRLDQAG